MKLLFRTRGNAAPQGKPRVYYTGHPEDLNAYFDEITGDILKSQNCAIYYDAEPAAAWDREELLHQLEQMQLLVIPVTSRFLFRPSRALEVEFPFAMEHHIPVLPLMQESGLEEDFNRICGDLQMLDRNNQDATALPYGEKLQKFLDSVLVGDELAEKVRAAFDAYVFLSYRKKDRRHAQELMRLIHKNDFCRDIAIWYDEFLTPGENFNQAIAAALEKCDLFALTVTPNIVEENNYVITTEYPEARKSGKPVLPVEMVPTDRDALRTSFQDLPPCAGANREDVLSASLLEAVQKLAIRENDGSPQHNFFIGLAYLNGIDVEVDRRRALELITGAAEAGLPEALKKLVAMYRGGDGVERDYRAAIRWQEKLTALCRVRYEESQTEGRGHALLAGLRNLGNYWEELAELPSARDTYEEARRTAEQLAEKTGSVDARFYLANIHECLGRVSKAEGHLAQAREHYLQALEIAKQLDGEEELREWIREELSSYYGNLGGLSLEEGQLAQAEDYYSQARTLCEALYEETAKEGNAQRLSGIYMQLGDICEERDRLTQAEDYYSQALALSRMTFEADGSPQARRILSGSYIYLGRISRKRGRLAQAKDYYTQAFELLKTLHEEMGAVSTSRALSESYGLLGHLSEQEGQLDQAKAYYLEGLALRKALYGEVQTVGSRRDLAESYKELGRLSQQEGRLTQARDYCLEELALRSALREETGTVRARQDLSDSYDRLGGICIEQGQLERAKEYFLQALEIDRQLAEETETVLARRKLYARYYRLGTLCEKQGRSFQALQHYVDACKICEPLSRETEDLSIKADLAMMFERFGMYNLHDKSFVAAKFSLTAAMHLREELYEKTGGAEEKRDLSLTYNNLGCVCREEEAFDEARGYFEKAVELDLQLCEETQHAEVKRAAVRDCTNLGMLCGEMGHPGEALTYYTLARELGAPLSQRTGAPEDRDALAYVLFRIALLRTGEERRPLFSQAYEIWSRLAEEFPDQSAYARRKAMAQRRLDQPEEK